MSLLGWIGRLALLAALAACGGGSDGVGSGGTGAPAVHAGTVTGFGSVIVDGTAYDDAGAAVVAEQADGSTAAATLRLGHRVEIELGASADVARSVRLQAELRGSVAAVGTDALQVLGQEVRVNRNARAGPRTQFGGGLRLDALAVGDRVEVHGFRRRIDGVWTVQATRIERAAAPDGLLVAGLVEDLDRSGGATRFRIGALRVEADAAQVVPTSATLANGARVTVWGSLPPGAAGEPALIAQRLRIAPRTNGAFEGVLAGGIGAVDAAAGRFDLGGTPVRYAGAEVVPRVATVAEGLYARVQGRWADDGSFVATKVILRGVDDTPAAEVTGVIAGWDAATQRFTVRGVAVDAAGATLDGCPAGGLADGLRVQVRGDLGSDGVAATAVRCLGG